MLNRGAKRIPCVCEVSYGMSVGFAASLFSRLCIAFMLKLGLH